MLRNLAIFFIIMTLAVAAAAQETESAPTSGLTGVALPAGAQRVLPGSVPAEISQAFEKITSATEGKLEKGDSEVLVWSGGGYRKANAQATVDRVAASLKAAGWNYSVEGSEDGLTIFSAILNGPSRRGLVGFYGATDDALVIAWVELMPVGAARTENPVSTETQTSSVSGGSLLGTWGNGRVSMLNEKNLYTGQIASRGGTIFKYVFTREGRFEFIGLMESTMYGCTTTIFNDKRGTYKVNGSTITLQPTKNYWRNQYSCSPSSNKEQNYTLKPETYTYRVDRNEYGKEQVCLNDGKNDACYERQ